MEITISYTVLIIFAGLYINNKSQLQRRNYVIFVTVLLTLVAGLRSIWVGTDDTSLYYYHFLENMHQSIAEIWETEKKDPLYYVFQKILSIVVGNNYQLLLLISAAFYAISVGNLIYLESKNPLVSYILLLSMGFFFFSMNGLRQTLAMSVLMFAYFPLRNRNLIKFILLVALASAFHKTAIVFLLAYPATRAKINATTVTLYLVVFLFCLAFAPSILGAITEHASQYDNRFQYYLTMSQGLTYSGLVQLILFGAFSISRYKPVLQLDSRATLLYILLVWAILFQTMATTIAEMFRIAMYFSAFLIILIPKVLDTLSYENKRLITLSLCTALIIYFLFLGTGKVPHHFFFESGWGI